MALLPRYVKKFYFPSGGTRIQKQINGFTLSMTNYAAHQQYVSNNQSVGSNGNYVLRQCEGTLYPWNPPDTYMGNVFTLTLYLTEAKWKAYVDELMVKLNAGFTGTYQLAADANIASEALVIFTDNANYPAKALVADAITTVSTNTFNATSLIRNVEFSINLGASYTPSFDGSKSTSSNYYKITAAYFQTNGSFRFSQWSEELKNVLYGMYNVIKNCKVAAGPANVTSGTSGNFSSRNTNYSQFAMFVKNPNIAGYSGNDFIGTGLPNIGNALGAWTQSGTVDPTDPSETPTPPSPIDPDPVPPYDPWDPPTPNPDPTDPINPPDVPDINGADLGFFTVYNPTATAMRLIAQAFWNPSLLDLIKQYFNNPMETVIGFGMIPVKPSIGGNGVVHFGTVSSGVSAPIVNSDYKIINCGSRYIAPYYNSYLDYEPYTKMSMFIPYIGEFDLNPDEVTGKTLQVKISVNVITGDLVGVVLANGTVIYSAASNCMRALPLSQANYNQIIDSAISAVTTISSVVAAGAAGAAGAGAIGGSAIATPASGDVESAFAQSAAQSLGNNAPPLMKDVMSAKMHYHRAGMMGTGSGQLANKKPYITIIRPNLMLPDGSDEVQNSNLKAYKGYPCNKILQLTSAVGYTVVEDARLSISGATAVEVEEILALLKGGFIG